MAAKANTTTKNKARTTGTGTATKNSGAAKGAAPIRKGKTGQGRRSAD